jgi:hypothetical protein
VQIIVSAVFFFPSLVALSQPLSWSETAKVQATSVATNIAIDLVKGRGNQAARAFTQASFVRFAQFWEIPADELMPLGSFQSTGPPVISSLLITVETFSANCSQRGTGNDIVRIVRAMRDNSGLVDFEDSASTSTYRWGIAPTTVTLQIIPGRNDREQHHSELSESDKAILRKLLAARTPSMEFRTAFTFAARFPRPDYPVAFASNDPESACGMLRKEATRTATYHIITVPVIYEHGRIGVGVEFDHGGSPTALYVSRDEIRAAVVDADRKKHTDDLIEHQQKAVRDAITSLQRVVADDIAHQRRVQTAYGEAFDANEAKRLLAEVGSACQTLAATFPAAMRTFLQKELAAVAVEPSVTTVPSKETPVQYLAVVEDRSMQSVVRNLLAPFRKILSQNGLSPDIAFDSNVPNARIVISAGNDPRNHRVVYTKNRLPNVWCGLYSGTIELAGFKNGSFELNLIDETRLTVECALAELTDDSSSFCQFVDS